MLSLAQLSPSLLGNILTFLQPQLWRILLKNINQRFEIAICVPFNLRGTVFTALYDSFYNFHIRIAQIYSLQEHSEIEPWIISIGYYCLKFLQNKTTISWAAVLFLKVLRSNLFWIVGDHA